MKFKYMSVLPPIDYWDGAQLVDDETAKEVTKYMPDETRDGTVYKLLVPDPEHFDLKEVYLCKGENNGDVYAFSETEVTWTCAMEQCERIECWKTKEDN